MTAPVVRLAGPADAERIEELRQRARREVEARRGGSQLIESRSPEHAEGDRLVADFEGVVLGYAIVRRRGTTAVVEELYTEPRARGVGIGHALIAAATSSARRAGCTAIESAALPGDRDTKNFFESHGMRARLLVVQRDLDSP